MLSTLKTLLQKTRWMFLLFFLSFTTTSVVWAGYHQKKVFSVSTAILKNLKLRTNKLKHRSSCSCTWDTMSFRKKNYYRLHRKAGAALQNAELISDFEHQLELQSKDILVPIGDSEGYLVQSMNHGSPYLHKDALEMLNEIEERFIKKQEENNLPKAQFVISSAVRTEIQQKKLSKRNRNATKGISSHSMVHRLISLA